jgi:hypothetical protein
MGKMLLFALVGIVFLGPICFLSLKCTHQSLTAPVFHFGKEITILIAGDSHAEVSVNPSLLPHSMNIAQNCENYFYTYYKLCHFIDNNPQVSTVVLAFSWHNFARDYQEPILFGDVGRNVDFFFPLLDQSGKDLIKSWKSSYIVPWARYTIGLPLQVYRDRLLQRQLLGLPLKREDFSFFGGYESLKTSNIDQENINKKLRLYYNGLRISDYNMSKYMTEYLHKILKLCSQRKIKVVLFNSPVHQIYRDGIPYRAFHDLDSLQLKLRSQFDNVVYIDCSNLQLPSENYYDGDHVNSRGSTMLTKYLADELGKMVF